MFCENIETPVSASSSDKGTVSGYFFGGVEEVPDFRYHFLFEFTAGEGATRSK